MMRVARSGSSPLILMVALAACGGGETDGTAGADAAHEESASPSSPPAADWLVVDHGNRTARLELIAGATTANHGWNYNGRYNGNATVTVPAGYTVTVHFTNRDTATAHSVGVDERTGNFPPNMSTPAPVFTGAITSDPLSLADATQPEEEESFTFVADTAGRYSLVCYVPGHAVTGQWIRFDVSSDGSAGVTEGS